MKKYAFFDLDNTLYKGYTTSNFFIYLAKKKLIPGWVANEFGKLQEEYKKGKMGYKEFCEGAVAACALSLKGKKVKEVDRWADKFCKGNGHFYPWAKNLLKFLKKEGFELFLISGTVSPFCKYIKESLGIKNIYYTKLDSKNGIYTGKSKTVIHFDEKKKIVNRLVKSLKGEKKIGFGDSTGDVDMLSKMDVAFVCNPFEKEMIKTAKEKGWVILDNKNLLKIVKSKI